MAWGFAGRLSPDFDRGYQVTMKMLVEGDLGMKKQDKHSYVIGGAAYLSGSRPIDKEGISED